MDQQDSQAVALPPRSGPTVGLALGGGGARGLVHIDVLEAFDELGLRPDIIAGTSIGAIFGAAYASGLAAAEIRERAVTLLGRPAQIVRHLIAGSGDSFLDLWNRRPLSRSLMNPQALLETVFSGDLARDFSELALPLLVVATDFHRQEPFMMDAGDLLPAVAASMALPALFQPVVHDGRVLVDGGLTNPLPFDLIEPRVDVTVAIDVTGGPVAAELKPPSAFEAIVAASQIMQNAIVKEKLKRHEPDIVIRPPVERFRVLEFYKVRQILEAAAPLKDELKRALDARLNAALERSP